MAYVLFHIISGIFLRTWDVPKNVSVYISIFARLNRCINIRQEFIELRFVHTLTHIEINM